LLSFTILFVQNYLYEEISVKLQLLIFNKKIIPTPNKSKSLSLFKNPKKSVVW